MSIINRKYRKIVFPILAVLILGLLFGALYNHNRKKEQVLKDEATKFENLLDLTSNPGGNSKPPDEPHQNIGTGIRLLNRIEFIDNLGNEEDAILIANKVAESFEYLDIIRSDSKKFSTEEYFKENKQVIYNIYGIDKLNEYDEFVRKINSIEKIQDYIFRIDTIKKEGNVYYIDIEFKNSEPVTLNAKAYISDRANGTLSIYIK